MPATPILTLRRFADRAALQQALEERLRAALTLPEPAPVMLSGGSTPIPAYGELGRRGTRGAPGLAVLFSDDRYVPVSSDQSNYHQSRPLLDVLALPPEQVLRVRTELPLPQAASEYDRALRTLTSGGRRIGLGLLGLGADGHTASLFGADDLERARGQYAIAVHRPDGRDAVSVTPAVLERVEELVFVVAGEDKRAAVAALLSRDPTLTAWQAVCGCQAVEVWADAAAAPAA